MPKNNEEEKLVNKLAGENYVRLTTTKNTMSENDTKSLTELTSIYNKKATEYGNVAEFPIRKSFKNKEAALKAIAEIDFELEEEVPAKLVEDAKKAAKKKAKKTKAVKPDVEAEEAEEEAPKKKKTKAKAADKDEAKTPAKRGRKMKLGYEPLAKQVEPREGTIRATCLAMLLQGTTLDELEKTFAAYRDRKQATWKVSARYRAREILKLLNLQNGYGFMEEDGKIYATVAE